LFAALLFAVHPIQTQAVTYIVQRFASLAALFYLFALVTYIKFRLISLQTPILEGQHHRPGISVKRYALYAVSLISVILAMKTKEFAFTLPVVMAICEFMFFKETLKRRMLYLAPIILTMVIIPPSLSDTSGSLSEIGGIDEAAAEISGARDKISRWDYLNTQFRVIVTYIRLLFLPISQNLDYDYPIYRSFFSPAVILSFMFLLLLFGIGIYLFYISRITHCALRITAFGIFWFFVTLSVESSVIPIDALEHRVYLPSVDSLLLTSAIRLLAQD
jgi:hypothetical protein